MAGAASIRASSVARPGLREGYDRRFDARGAIGARERSGALGLFRTSERHASAHALFRQRDREAPVRCADQLRPRVRSRD